MANTLASIAKYGIGYLAVNQLVKAFSSKKIQFNRNAVRTYANKLANAKNDKEAVASVVGLLGICSMILTKVDKLRFLGGKVKDVTKSSELKKYLESVM